MHAHAHAHIRVHTPMHTHSHAYHNKAAPGRVTDACIDRIQRCRDIGEGLYIRCEVSCQLVPKAEPPGQHRSEGVDQVEDAPGNNDVVVERDVHRDSSHGKPNAPKGRGGLLPQFDGAQLEGLSQTQLQVKERDPNCKQHDEIRNEEGT